MSKLQTAIWTGPFPAQLPAGVTVLPGETAEVREVDLLSGHWRPVEQAKRSPKGES